MHAGGLGPDAGSGHLFLDGIGAFLPAKPGSSAYIQKGFQLQKWVVIIATGVLGAATIVGSIVLMFNPHAQVLEKPVQAVLKASPLAAILFIVVAILGIVMQVRSTRDYA